MNLKLRLKNKVTLLAIVSTALAILYTFLGMVGVVPSVTQEQWHNLFVIVIQLLVLLGVVVDPTTDGIKDSAQAMEYTEPRKNDPSDEEDTVTKGFRE